MKQKSDVTLDHLVENAPPKGEQGTSDFVRNNRRYTVGNLSGKARVKIRYIESTQPDKSCKFL